MTTLDHVRNATGAANEHWVRALHPEPPEAMLLRFHDVTKRWAESLSAISPEEYPKRHKRPGQRFSTKAPFLQAETDGRLSQILEPGPFDDLLVGGRLDNRRTCLAIAELRNAPRRKIGR